MSTDPREDLTADERRACAELRDGPTPIAELEDRVVEDLRRRGLLEAGAGTLGAARRGPASTPWWHLAAAAALAATFLLGFGAGRWTGPPAVPGATDAPSAVPGADAPPADHYVLLLYETPDQMEVPEAETARLVAEYSAWAEDQRRAGHLVAGEKLAADGLVVVEDDGVRVTPQPGAGTSRILAGFFQVRARSYEEARRIAETCPHLDYGGEIEVRRIEDA